MSTPELLAAYKAALASGDAKQVTRIENSLIKDNKNLVLKLVGKLKRRMTTQSSQAEDADLFQAGCLGMLRAWKGWIPSKAKFSTYAAHWIRHEVQECLGKSQPIFKPRQQGKPWAAYQKQQQIRAREGREATAEELGVTEEKWDYWRTAPTVVRSLDEEANEFFAPHNNEGGGASINWGQLTPDNKPTPEIRFEHAELTKLLEANWDQLTDQEAYVVTALFLEELPYQDIALTLGLGTEQVRRIRSTALSKLRDSVVI